jgi:phage terminase large subunit-like protein
LTKSLASLLASRPESEQKAILARLTPEKAEELKYDWRFWGRPDQLTPDGDWLVWLILAGRGWGKTRTGVECVRAEVEAGRAGRIAIVAETAADARDVIAEGPSGFLSIGPPEKRPLYESSKRRFTWPNGAIGTLYNATEPDQLRGPQHDFAWCDELAKWSYAKPGTGSSQRSLGQETWDMLQFGLRAGRNPRSVVTTTPRPVKLVRSLLAAPRTHITRGTTMDNAANLAPDFVRTIRARYAGTRIGRQELNAEVLDDVPNALWTLAMFDKDGFRRQRPDMARVVVSVDPSGARGADDEGADSIGIIVAGKGVDGRAYVLADRTCRLSPAGWGRRAVEAYREFHADRIIAERNFGGAMVESTIRNVDPNVSYKEVTASSGRGKIVRAEPAAALYEQTRVSHSGPVAEFEMLEAQMCAFTTTGFIGDGSPDRVDALVWALDELIGLSGPEDYLDYLRAQVVKPVGPAPALPWQEQRKEEPDSGDLLAIYNRARKGNDPAPPACKRCGKDVGANRQTDGVDFWCVGCR